MTNWRETTGLDGKKYLAYFFDVIWVFGRNGIDVVTKHNLLTLLGKLDVLGYQYDSDGAYEISLCRNGSKRD